jgi:hypothetical protein
VAPPKPAGAWQVPAAFVASPNGDGTDVD